METPQNGCTAEQLLHLLPLSDINQIAHDTNVDYKAKKITGIRMISIMLVSFLSTTRLSQRYIGEELSNHEFSELFNLSFMDGKLSHSSVSHRLKSMNVDFFEKSYHKISEKLQSLLPPEYLEDRYVISDSSMVQDVAGILKQGMETGRKDGNGTHRKQLKYSIAMNGFDMRVAKIFDRQNALSEDVALARTVKSAIRTSQRGDIFLFDRGTASYSNLTAILDLANDRGAAFIGRLKASRKYEPTKGNASSIGASNGDVEVIEDTEAFLYDGRKKSYGESRRFRVIKARLLRQRPRSRATKGRKRKKEDVILLITNDFKSSPLDICNSYKRRWSIEVFFKFLKQNLSFAHLLSSSRNGLMIILYMMLITAALVKIFEILNNLGPRIAILRFKIQLENWLLDHPVVCGTVNESLSNSPSSDDG